MIMQIELDLNNPAIKKATYHKEKTKNGVTIKCPLLVAAPLSHREYFQLPNQLFDMDLSYGEIAVYACLMRFENRRSYTCYPSYKTIGKSIGMNSPNTVAKYVQMLVEKRMIETSPTNVMSKEGRIQNGNLWYKILPISFAIEAFKERQLVNGGLK